MLFSNSPTSVVRTNRQLNKGRSTVYSKKEDFFRYHTSGDIKDIKELTEEERAALHLKIRKEVFIRRATDAVFAAIGLLILFGIMKYLL